MNPLDMLNPTYDPSRDLLDRLQPAALRAMQQAQGQGQPQQTSPIPVLNPEEENSALGTLSNAGLGALHYVGATLDKSFGGRAIRGVLGGHPEELASVVPFSDTMGLTDEKNRVSGEDLLKKAGVLGERDPNQGWLQARDLAGPAVEMALDPASYLTLGTGSALTEAGQAAEKAGTLAGSNAGRIAAGQSGLMGLGLPFSKPSVILGTGKTGEAIGGLLDRGLDAAAYSLPGRVASSLFDKRVGNTLSEAGQRAARAASAAEPELQAAARGRFLDVARPLNDAGMLADAATRADTSRQLRAVLEGRASALPGNPLDQAAQAARGHLDAMQAEAQAVGRPVHDLVDDMIDFAPRQKTRYNNPLAGMGGSGGPDFPTTTGNQAARLDPLKNLEGGTDAINAMAKDANISGPDRLLAGPAGNTLREQQYIREKYLGMTPAMEQELHDLRSLPVEPMPTIDVPHPTIQGQTIEAPNPMYQRLQQLTGLHKQGEQLADIMGSLHPDYAAKQLDYFGNNALTDLGTYATGHARAQGAADAVHTMLASGAKVMPPSQDTVPILDALAGAGLTHDTLQMQGGGASSGVQATARAKLAAAGVDASDLSNVRVPKALAEDAARYGKGFQVPEPLKPVVGAWDYLTNLNKAWQTSFWPATNGRNAAQSLWQNVVGGATDPRHSLLSPLAHAQPIIDAEALRTGKTIEGAADIYKGQGLSDADATNKLREEMFQWGARGTGGAGEDALGLGTHERPGDFVHPNSPEAAQPGLLSQANPARALPKSMAELNPLDVRGVGGRLESGNSLVKYGQDLAESIDDTGRSSAYIAFRRQGYEPAAALERATDLHYDYSNLTGFESQVMRRAMPFYNWTRQNLPAQLKQLAEHPGGATSAALKATDDMRQKEGFVPDYISEGLHIPVGKEANGNQRFLTDLGLPFEDIGDVFGTGPQAVKKTGEKLLGNLNPLIKGPLELATGKQFFSDRDLTDLRGPTTGLLPQGLSNVVDQAVMNSPLQRFYGAGHTLADERKDAGTKALNLLAPAKVTDVDMEKARGIGARDLIEESLRGNPNVHHFEELYARPEDAAKLSPEDLRMLSLYKTLEAQQSKRARQAK